MSGVDSVVVNHVTDTVSVSYDPSKITTEEIRAFMKKLGYEVSIHH